MTFSGLNDPGCVLQAIAEFDAVGRDAFLAKYGFRPSRRFMVSHNGRLYDSKPILAAAHFYQFGEQLSWDTFTGGLSGTVEKLSGLGFEVVNTDHEAPTRDDVEAALDLYDSMGRDRFLEVHRVPKAWKFLLRARGRDYDAKAIVVVAMTMNGKNPGLAASDVKSERASVALPLQKLGYTVVEKDQGEHVSGNKISDLIERVLELQTKYNNNINDPAMVERRSALEQLDAELVQLCGPTFGWPGGSTWQLSGDVSLGAGYAPKVAWARLTDRRKSSSATSGWYVVLLFAADGSSCVVSLNQGVSTVTGPNKNDQISQKAHEAFSFLDDSPVEGPGRGWAPFGGVPVQRLAAEPDLRGGSLGKAYEIGHVDGVVYKKGSVPSDEQIVAHTKALLGMLGRLYDREDGIVTEDFTTHVLLRWSENQAAGFDTIAEHRRVIEDKGSVVWAKFGASLANSKVEMLNSQLEHGSVYAFLVGGRGPTGQPTMFVAHIESVNQGTADIDQDLIPGYYRDSLTGNETCFTFSAIEESDIYQGLDELLCLVSDPTKLLSDSMRSQNTVFFVRYRNKNDVASSPEPRGGNMTKLEQVAHELNMSASEVQKLVNGVTGAKKQMILMGPPGTGKTFVAQKLSTLLVDDPECVRLVQFHPSYGYEDFVEGLRPMPSAGGAFEFTRVPGVLVEMTDAIEKDGKTRVLIIDEINRANIPKVFGELMFLLEYREQSMRLMLGDRKFSLPDNLIIIGTMNTADRSIRTLDVAMRRRFRFFELPPRTDVIDRQYAKTGWTNSVGAGLAAGLEKLNQKLLEDVDRHHTIGHSYLLQKTMNGAVLRDVWEQEMFPLIEDYFFDRPEKAAEYQFDMFWPNA